MYSKIYSWIALDVNNHFNTSKCNGMTDNNQVDALLQDIGIQRKEVLALATIHVFQSNILKWGQ